MLVSAKKKKKKKKKLGTQMSHFVTLEWRATAYSFTNCIVKTIGFFTIRKSDISDRN